MSDVVSAVSDARNRVDSASAASARAQAQVDAAESDASRILKLMSEEFGVSSVSEARSLLASLESQIQEQIAIVETALSEAEGVNDD